MCDLFQRNKIDLQLANLKQQNAMIDAAGSFLTPTHDQESLVKASEDFMRQYKELPPWVELEQGTIPQWSRRSLSRHGERGTLLRTSGLKRREERIDALKDHNTEQWRYYHRVGWNTETKLRQATEKR